MAVAKQNVPVDPPATDPLEWSRLSMVAGLTSTLIHDLNNPLAGILGYAQYLIRKNDLPEELREPLQDIYFESVRLNTMIVSFANLSRKDESPGTFLVEEAMREVLLFHQKQFEKRGAKFEVFFSDDFEVMTWRNLLQQTMYHLLEAVLRALPADAMDMSLQLSSRRHPDALTISIIGPLAEHIEMPHEWMEPVELLITNLGASLIRSSQPSRLDLTVTLATTARSSP